MKVNLTSSLYHGARLLWYERRRVIGLENDLNPKYSNVIITINRLTIEGALLILNKTKSIKNVILLYIFTNIYVYI